MSPPKETLKNKMLVGPNVAGYSVGAWVPSSNGTGKPLAVALSLHIEGFGDVVLRLKSRKAVQELKDLLDEYTKQVFGVAPKDPITKLDIDPGVKVLLDEIRTEVEGAYKDKIEALKTTLAKLRDHHDVDGKALLQALEKLRRIRETLSGHPGTNLHATTYAILSDILE